MTDKRTYDLDRLKRRYSKEKRFKFFGAAALAFTAAFVLFLLFDIVRTGLPVFTETSVKLSITLEESQFKENDYSGMAREALRAQFPEITSRADRKKLDALLSNGAADDVQKEKLALGSVVTRTILLSSDADLYLKTGAKGRLDGDQIKILETLK